MGVVFQARHIFLKTSHAIKIILPDLVGNDPMLATRFRQEALAAAAIRHQNIIAVTDFGMVRGTMPFLVMEFIKGKSLQDILAEEGAMAPARALELISAVAAGVGAAHRQNIVHRDLKPLNIMVQDGLPVAEGLKILDFGLAKIKSGDLLGSFVQAKTSGLMGSPFYMAPEQWSDDEPDARADIYSLGVILFQMLCGEVPFKGSSIPSIMKKHLTLPPPTFQSMGVTVPAGLEAVVRHSLEKEVEARIDSVETFLKELRGALNSSPISVRTTRETDGHDPNKTMVSELSSTGPQPPVVQDTNFTTSFDSLAGTDSSSALDQELQQQLSNTAAAHRREQEKRERVAREELVRETEARRQAQEEADRKRREEEERFRMERVERDEIERKQHEKLERMALQAQELEDRLERLATSMPPENTLVDPETTRVQENVIRTQMGSSFPGVQPVKGQPVVIQVPAKTKSYSILWLIAGTVALLVIVAGVGGYIILRPRPTPIVQNPPKVNTPTIKAELASIEGGTFQMGRDNGPPQETPAHPIKIQSFLMDKTEVTNAEYADFVRETNHAPPGHWAGPKPPFGQELWPVVNVSVDDVNAFAGWRSKRDGVGYRLPTEEEWEYAARNGEKSDLYPWGKNWQDKLAVLKEATPSPVGSRPAGKNRWGVVDLIGNVWEWTSSKVSAYPGNPVKIPASTQEWVTIRGGCYVSDPENKDNPVSSCMRQFVPPTTKTPLLGFRLVRSAS
jgi:formylglycine-generating enzyme required for sulfatase activity/serine/threonine protein kinase